MGETSTNDVTVALTGQVMHIATGSVGTVAEVPRQGGGHTISTTTPTKVHSVVESDVEGMSAKLIGMPDNKFIRERRVERCVVRWLEGQGYIVSAQGIVPGDDKHDRSGEDGVLTVDSMRLTLQVVSIPIDQDFWKSSGRDGRAEKEGDWESWRRCVTEAIRKKCDRYPASARRTMLLALDAEHFGTLLNSPDTLMQISQEYEALAADAHHWAVVLVGPTERSVSAVHGPPAANSTPLKA